MTSPATTATPSTRRRRRATGRRAGSARPGRGVRFVAHDLPAAGDERRTRRRRYSAHPTTTRGDDGRSPCPGALRNRFCRAQATAGHRSTSASRRLTTLVTVEMAQREREVQHEQQDVRRHGRRPAGDGDLRDLRELEVADGDGQRRVLREVEVLVGERRRRRSASPAAARRGASVARASGPSAVAASTWPFGDGLDAPAHDLGDVAGGVEDERTQQGGELGRHADAAGRRPASSSCGAVTSTGPPSATSPMPTTTTKAAAPGEPGAGRSAGPVEDAAAATARRPRRPRPPPRASPSTSQPCRRCGSTAPPRRGRTATSRPSTVVASSSARQLQEHGDVGEDDQHEQRHVAEQLDVDLRRLRHEPVARQASDADERAEHRRDRRCPPPRRGRCWPGPTRIASCTLWVGRNELPAIGKLAGWSR